MKTGNWITSCSGGEGERLCTGHACITEYKGELYIVYGRYKMPRQGYSREICCDKVEFLDEFRLKGHAEQNKARNLILHI